MEKRGVVVWGILVAVGFHLGISQVRQEDEELKMRKAEVGRYVRLQDLQRQVSGSGQNIDVTYYALNLEVLTDSTSLAGSVTIAASITAATASSLQLDLQASLVIDSIHVDGQPASWTRGTSTFSVTLSPVRTQGSGVVLDVFYHGQPYNSGFGSFAFSTQPGNTTPWVWSLSEPYGAPDWWPCKDDPADKADSLDVWITCDQSFKAGSQGKLVSVTSLKPGTLTYHWQHRYPIANYLISVAVTNYAAFSNWFKYSPTDSMEVLNYVLPASLASAQTILPLTPTMLQIYSDLYGLYPFVTEKYGHSQFGWGGGMEHQTMTSLGGFTESLVAHELAHQWFGDMITMKTWPDIWLNEGFATYSVALYYERRVGSAAYQTYMAGQMANAVNAVGSVHVQDTTSVGSLFNGNLVYAKGATVLHMLRHVIGDSLFFASMKAYASDSRFRFKNASTEDFEGVVEQVAGTDLSWFFQEWIYGEGYPRYNYIWHWTPVGAGVQMDLDLSQTAGTTSPSFFTMPIDVRISGNGGDTTIVVFNDSASQSWTWTIPFTPTTVSLDPGSWILKTTTESQQLPETYELSQNFPNPFNPSTAIHYFLPQRSRVRIDVLNLLGQVVDVLEESDRDAGEYEVSWNPKMSSGVYFCRLKASPLANPSDTNIRVVKMLYVK